MDKQEAQMILQSLRPKDLNSSDPAVIEALIFVENDSVLKAWWENQQAFDRRVAAKLREISLPEGLRSSILDGRKIVPFAPQPRFSFLLAAAAAIAILCVAGTFLQVYLTTGPLTSSQFAAMTVPLLNHDSPPLAMMSPDRDKLVAWLEQRNAPMGDLPAKMSDLSTVGCQKFMIHGHAVSLICFTMPSGGVAHLFMVDRDAISNSPGQANGLEFGETAGYSTATWSDDSKSYVLATLAGSDKLKQLL
jgi:hypothetical protein